MAFRMFCLVALISFLIVGKDLMAEDLYDRLKQYSVDAQKFEKPCTVHFDFSYLIEAKKGSSTSTLRIVGRQIVGENGKYRLDLMKETVTAQVARVTWEHYFEVPQGEKHYCFRLEGGRLQHVQFDKKVLESIKPPIARVDPYCFALAGGRERNFKPMGSVKLVLNHFTDFSGDFLRNKGNLAETAVQVDFDKDKPTRILQAKVFRASETCIVDNARSWKDVSRKTVTEQWFEAKVVNCTWTTIDDVDVPVSIRSIDRFYDCEDPTATEQFNGRFFDYDFKGVDEGIFFNPSRLTDEHLHVDFPYSLIRERIPETDK